MRNWCGPNGLARKPGRWVSDGDGMSSWSVEPAPAEGRATMTLTEFLLARIAEDEELARDATNDGHRWLVQEETIELWPDDLEPAAGFMHFPRKAHAYHAATWNPDRALAECAAKRRIVEEHTNPHGYGYCPTCTDESGDPQPPDCPTLRALASVYAAHPDYRQEWAP